MLDHGRAFSLHLSVAMRASTERHKMNAEEPELFSCTFRMHILRIEGCKLAHLTCLTPLRASQFSFARFAPQAIPA